MINEHPVRPSIVVGVDGSTSALHATRWAATEVGLRKLSLRLVHVSDPPAIHHPTTTAGQREYVDALRQHGRHCVREAIAAARSVAPAALRGVGALVGADEGTGALQPQRAARSPAAR
jgi:hypothetical protein